MYGLVRLYTECCCTRHFGRRRLLPQHSRQSPGSIRYNRRPGPVRANKKARTWQKEHFVRKLRLLLLDLRPFLPQLRLPQKETATT